MAERSSKQRLFFQFCELQEPDGASRQPEGIQGRGHTGRGVLPLGQSHRKGRRLEKTQFNVISSYGSKYESTCRVFLLPWKQPPVSGCSGRQSEF